LQITTLGVRVQKELSVGWEPLDFGIAMISRSRVRGLETHNSMIHMWTRRLRSPSVAMELFPRDLGYLRSAASSTPHSLLSTACVLRHQFGLTTSLA